MRLMEVLLTSIAFVIIRNYLLGFLRTSSRTRLTFRVEVAVAGLPLSGHRSMNRAPPIV